MAQKNNIRSIRFSDELAELIDRQAGRTFTEKFENLITRCVWELPQKERQLDEINQEIIEKRKQLGRMAGTAYQMSKYLQELEKNLKDLSINIAKAQEHKWESE